MQVASAMVAMGSQRPRSAWALPTSGRTRCGSTSFPFSTILSAKGRKAPRFTSSTARPRASVCSGLIRRIRRLTAWKLAASCRCIAVRQDVCCWRIPATQIRRTSKSGETDMLYLAASATQHAAGWRRLYSARPVKRLVRSRCPAPRSGLPRAPLAVCGICS